MCVLPVSFSSKGRGEKDKLLNDLYVLDLDTMSWKLVSSSSSSSSFGLRQPSPRNQHTLTYIRGGRILLLGGWDGHQPKDDVWLLSTGISSLFSLSFFFLMCLLVCRVEFTEVHWRSVPTTGPHPPPRESHTLSLIPSLSSQSHVNAVAVLFGGRGAGGAGGVWGRGRKVYGDVHIFDFGAVCVCVKKEKKGLSTHVALLLSSFITSSSFSLVFSFFFSFAFSSSSSLFAHTHTSS